MRVAMQIILAMATSVLALSALVHFSGTADAILEGMNTPSTRLQIHMDAKPPADPAQSEVLQHIYSALDIRTSENDYSAVSISYAYEDRTIHDGSYVPMSKSSTAPSVKLSDDGEVSGHLYTWVLIDIDAPSPADPSHSPFLHWIVANLDPTGQSTPLDVVSYYPVSPPTGIHRYVGLLFSQDRVVDKETSHGYEVTFGKNRAGFDVAAYAYHEDLKHIKRSWFYSHPNSS